ncbi:MAG: AAA family ATPase [Candidatus Altiarchaeota archaeon]|nr:AAA family ATPase [Candidatus Altiarchaeota archaeon]
MNETGGKIIGVISVKGGVGKTTTVANLGAVLSNEFSVRCVVIDANVSVPNLGLHLNITEPEVTLQDILMDENSSISDAVYEHDSGLHIVPTALSEVDVDLSLLKTKMRSLAKDYDVLIMDSSPGIGEEIRATIDSSDELLIISSLDLPTLSATLKAIKLANDLNTRITGVILNRIMGVTFELSIEEVKSTLETPILAVIPEDPKVREALSTNMPVVLYAPKSPASREFRKLAAVLIGQEEPKKGFFFRVIDSVFKIFRK